MFPYELASFNNFSITPFGDEALFGIVSVLPSEVRSRNELISIGTENCLQVEDTHETVVKLSIREAALYSLKQKKGKKIIKKLKNIS